MISKHSTFSRFFGVYCYVPREHLKNILYGTLLGIFTISCLEIFENVFQAIEKKDIDTTYKILFLYASISLAILVIRLLPFAYRIGWPNLIFFGQKEFYKEYLQKYVQADGNSVEKIGTGKFISILEKGVAAWFDTAFNLGYFGVQYIIIIVYSLYKIFSLSFLAGNIALLLLLLSLVGAFFANGKMREKRRFRYEAQNEVSRTLVRVLMSKNELLQNNQLSHEIQTLGNSLDTAAKTQWNVNFWYNVLEEIPRFLFAGLRIGVYLYILSQMLRAQADLSELSIFITIMVMMDKAINELLHFFRNFLKDIGLVEKLWETFDMLPSIQGYEEGKIFYKAEGDIEVKNITYKYDEKKVFSDFSLSIQKGKKTAFVGLSGAGKTTLLKLIAGYIHPQSGSIQVLGNTLSETALKTYYPHIGYMTQEPSVFDASIRENMLASAGMKSSITEQDIKEALLKASCDFVFEFVNGLDTEIGERGIRLSGGQKQRLAIAKLFLKNPEIILLDEPTSALDSFSEEKITQALNILFEGRTVIIVAHRLQTVKRADEIIVLENGKIEERGTHTELIKKKGIYNRMLELQSGF